MRNSLWVLVAVVGFLVAASPARAALSATTYVTANCLNTVVPCNPERTDADKTAKKVLNNDCTQATLKWNSVSGAVGYVVRVHKQGCTWANLNDVGCWMGDVYKEVTNDPNTQTQSFTWNFRPGEKYKYQIQAKAASEVYPYVGAALPDTTVFVDFTNTGYVFTCQLPAPLPAPAPAVTSCNTASCSGAAPGSTCIRLSWNTLIDPLKLDPMVPYYIVRVHRQGCTWATTESAPTPCGDIWQKVSTNAGPVQTWYSKPISPGVAVYTYTIQGVRSGETYWYRGLQGPPWTPANFEDFINSPYKITCVVPTPIPTAIPTVVPPTPKPTIPGPTNTPIPSANCSEFGVIINGGTPIWDSATAQAGLIAGAKVQFVAKVKVVSIDPITLRVPFTFKGTTTNTVTEMQLDPGSVVSGSSTFITYPYPTTPFELKEGDSFTVNVSKPIRIVVGADL